MEQKIIEQYLLQDDLRTYDPYDIWITDFGKKTRKFYYKNRYFGLLPAGLLSIYDLYLNNRLKWGYSKQEYPIVRAQACLALLNLYQKEPKEIYLQYAKKHIDWLLTHYSQGYSGYCWGLNFDWVYSAEGTYDSNIPFSTHTPYPLEAMVAYYRITKDSNLIEPIKSVFLFVEYEIQIMIESHNKLILSYGVEKDRIVSNSNSYLMYVYALLMEFLPEERAYIEGKIYRIYNFLCSVQQGDGSWRYSPYEEDTFIDCFHSAFILKNLIKTNKLLALEGVENVLDRGYGYLLDNFFDEKKELFKRFSQSNKISMSKFDLYDNAEMLNLASLLEDHHTVEKLSKAIKKNFIKKRGIASMIDLFGVAKNFNHMRWAVVPYLHALSNVKEMECAAS